MNIEAYRKTVRRRVRVITGFCLLYAAVIVAVHGMRLEGTGFTGGFLNGAVSAVVICLVLMMPRYRKALRDDRALRRLWNQEHDERMRAIQAKAGLPMLGYTSVAMIAFGLLIGPWSTTAAMALLIAATAQLCVGAAVKLVCMRRM